MSVTFSAELLHAELAPLLEGAAPVALAVALSGGADSAALAHALAALKAREPGWQVRALHVNHGLSAAAGPLAAAARALAQGAGLPFTELPVTVATDSGESLEAAARRVRYGALAAALAAGEQVLSAHHLEDQAETLLLQLLRGAGPRGLASMPVSAPLGRGRLLRPLLGVPREALRAYALAERLPVAEDPMNAEERYDRVFLRARLWPVLTGRWPEAAETLARAAGHAAEAQRLLDGYSAELVERIATGGALSIEGLLALPVARRGEVIRYWLSRQGLRAPPARRQARIDTELLRARGTGQPRIAWDGGELRTFAGFLYAFAPLAPLAVEGLALGAPGGPDTALGPLGRLEVTQGRGGGLKPAPPGRPFMLTTRVGGERLALHAGGPRRALKDLLREARLPPWARERAILVKGDTLAAVVLPHATWVAAEHAAAAGEEALGLAWRDAPAALQPAGRARAFIEDERPFR